MICTFFGHRDATEEIKPILKDTIVDLIENRKVNQFYVGNNGAFDRIVFGILKELSAKYPISFFVVLAYVPRHAGQDDAYTILPEGIEKVPKRFAIVFRNKWMIQRAEYVVGYVTHTIGSGAANFLEYAEKQKKKVILLSSDR